MATAPSVAEAAAEVVLKPSIAPCHIKREYKNNNNDNNNNSNKMPQFQLL